MRELFYETIDPITRAEAVEMLRSGDTEAISYGLLRASYHVEDWRWVQSECLRLLDSKDKHLQYIGAICLSHIARVHGKLDLTLVEPELKKLEGDPEIGGEIEMVLEDLEIFVAGS